MDVCKTINMDLINKVHIFEPMKDHIFDPNISIISQINLMFNYAKPRIFSSRSLASNEMLLCVFNNSHRSLFAYRRLIKLIKLWSVTLVPA